MKTIKKVPIVVEQVEFIPELSDMKECTLYVSQKYKTASHRCLCGCGNEVITPLIPSMWQATYTGDKISLSPSIGNYNWLCQSHYIITKNIANFV